MAERGERLVIAGYEIGEEVGRGPLGKVYAARHLKTGQQVIFRGFSRPPEADDEHWQQAIDRFTQELTAAARLNHPNIVKVLDFGEERGLYYVATEYFLARPVRQIIDQDERWPLRRILPLMAQVLRALDYAQEQGLAHGDITPYNLLVLEDGQVKVLNYGLAHVRHKLGSPYLSPEQLTGFPGDRRSDIYGLGAVVYEMLTKQPPFQGRTVEEVCRAIQSQTPPPVPNVRPYFQAILAKMLAKEPEHRYQSGEEVLDDLANERIPEGFAPEVAPPTQVVIPWEETHYQASPSLADYRLDESDLRQIRLRIYEQEQAQRARRAKWRWRLAAAAVFLSGFLFVRDGLRLPQRASQAAVAVLEGSPEVRRTGEEAWHPVRPGVVLKAGERVRTDDQSAALLKLADGARVRLGEDSLLLVRQLAFDPQTGRRPRTLELERGRLLARVRPRTDSPFEVVVRGTAVRVKGTLFGVLAEENKDTLIQTLEGVVEAVSSGQAETVAAGQQVAVPLGQPPLDPETLPAEEQDKLTQLAKSLEGNLLDLLRDAVSLAEEHTVLPLANKIASLADSLRAGKEATEKVLTGATDLAQATTAMRAICMALEGSPEYPRTLTLDTLEELGFDSAGANKILSCFEGNRLESYRSDGRHYEFTARAKDPDHTRLIARDGKIRVETTPFSEGKSP
ncbi:MAG TPA: hypothetical protein EYP85_02810 [Armatimonadetes bacterium]|nr:hypothetical protein [Armatimonadota bacterium]